MKQSSNLLHMTFENGKEQEYCETVLQDAKNALKQVKGRAGIAIVVMDDDNYGGVNVHVGCVSRTNSLALAISSLITSLIETSEHLSNCDGCRDNLDRCASLLQDIADAASDHPQSERDKPSKGETLN